MGIGVPPQFAIINKKELAYLKIQVADMLAPEAQKTIDKKIQAANNLPLKLFGIKIQHLAHTAYYQ